MRLGIMSFGTFLLLAFLLIVRTGVPIETVDTTFEGIDANFSNDMNFGEDENLSNFVKYTVKGIVDEAHGGFYLARFLNTFLPEVVMENLDIIIILVVLAMVAPLILYGGMTVVFLCMVLWDAVAWLREWWRRYKGGG